MTDDPLIGIQLANFRLEHVLGRGGMAQVYYGWDVKLQRPVAVKVVDARFRSNPAYAKRFVHEAQAVATWRHENIAQVYYADEEGDLYYFAMEYIDGLDLGKLLTQYASRGEQANSYLSLTYYELGRRLLAPSIMLMQKGLFTAM
jgi:eukaryotic-like serine/threonine-protein kinase